MHFSDFVKPNIAKMEAQGNVAGLIEALSHKDPLIRAKAALDLGKIGDVRAVEPLMSLLVSDPDDSVRCEVAYVLAYALKDIGKVVEPFIAALKDSWPNVRVSAVVALGRIGGARAVDALIAAIKDPSEWIRRTVVEELGKIGEARAVEPLFTVFNNSGSKVREEVTKALRNIGTQAVDPLIAALRNPDNEVRRNAAYLLGEINNRNAHHVEPLIASLRDSDIGVREAAAKALEGSVLGQMALKQFRLDEAVQKQDWQTVKLAISTNSSLEEKQRLILRLPVEQIDLEQLRLIAKGTYQLRNTYSLVLPILEKMQQNGWTIQQEVVEKVCEACEGRGYLGHQGALERDTDTSPCWCNGTGKMSDYTVSVNNGAASFKISTLSIG